MRSANIKGGRIVIGLTGGFGSGKSTVLSMLKRKGAVALDADATVGELLAEPAVLARIRRRFGADVFRKDGGLDRAALAGRIFTRTAERRALERILHPAVRRRMWKAVGTRGITVMDIPLLFESGWHKTFDRVVVVSAPMAARRRRLRAKGFSLADIRRRMAAQWPLERKTRQADVVIDNGGARTETKKQIDELWKRLSREMRGI